MNMLTIMTNCLTAKDICRTILEPRHGEILKDVCKKFSWFESKIEASLAVYENKANTASLEEGQGIDPIIMRD